MANETVINGAAGERLERKNTITVVEWDNTAMGGTASTREVLGVRTEDSSIEFNPDVATSTDILGKTYTDINKTEPQQSFDPYNLIGGSKLGAYLLQNALENNINAYNGKFSVYIITTALGTAGAYYAVKHTGCSIIPQSVGGDSYNNMPIEVHLSNEITVGTVDKLADDFEFTAKVSV